MRGLIDKMTLKTKFLAMMVSLCFLSVAALFILYDRAEKALLEEVKTHTEDLYAAIQISIEEISKSRRDTDPDSMKDLMKLRKKGLKEISVVNSYREVIASSNPKLIGRKLSVKGESIRNIGNVTEYVSTANGQKMYEVLLPVVIGKEKLGYIHLSNEYGDFAAVARSNHLNRLIATIAIFSLGILAAIYLSNRYTGPIQEMADAARKVAAGDLGVRLNAGGAGDEIGNLTKNFNEMVEKLQATRDLSAKLREAEHLSKIGTLASGIAHEVRNPLNFINLSIDHLSSTYSPGDPAAREGFRKSVANIKSEIKRLDEMIANFLNYGRPLNLKMAEVSIPSLVRETAELMAESCRVQRIALEVAEGPDDAAVMGDYKHIKTCLVNVLLNAVQAMPSGGTLSIEVESDGRTVLVRVADSGSGIAQANLQRIFEPYFTTKEVGIGLGLALTKRIVEEHGGAITVKSEVDRGTEVVMAFPALSRRAAAPEPRAVPAEVVA